MRKSLLISSALLLMSGTTIEAATTDASPMQLVASKAITPQRSINYYKDTNGLVRKMLVDKEKPTIATQPQPAIAAAAEQSGITLYEGFEGFDGETYDWIPDAWQDVSKTDPAHVAPRADSGLMNLTWAGEAQSMFFSPYAGNAFMRVQASMAIGEEVEEAQDEWLITPSIAVYPNSKLSFYMAYSPGWTRLNIDEIYESGAYVFDQWHQILEVQVSTDEGETWTKLWDAKEDAESYTQEELEEDLMLMEHPYVPVTVDLSDYANEFVDVAFRYVGIGEESVCLDEVKISNEDNGSVASLSLDGANKARLANGRILLSSSTSGSVGIYNAAGQKVAETTVDGTAEIPAQHLAHGLYVVRFSDGSTTKLLK